MKHILKNNNISKIAHVSDIHVRPYKRHDEFKHVFKNLYKSLSDNKADLIILTGDITHSKTEMSPELIKTIGDLFNELSLIAPLIIIPGNHDANLNNLNRLDALTPIVNLLQDNKNIFYIKDSTTIKCGNTYISHFSVFDDINKYPLASSIPNDLPKIVLYHGIVQDIKYIIKNENGYGLSGGIDVSLFNGYDFVMLGDIHKHQYIKNNIAYAGSLIQHNHGEDLSHGYILWDVINKTSNFIKVHNDYGFYTLELDSDIVPNISEIPKKCRLRLKIKNLEQQQINEVLKNIKKMYNPIEITINKLTSSNHINNNFIHDLDVTNVNYQNKLLKEYIYDTYPEVSEENIDKILLINNEANDNINLVDFTFNTRWELNYLKWSNLFSYGEDNYLNFSSLNGVVGLCGPNAGGKSSAIDILSFALFDKTSRESKIANILNINKKEFNCEVSFNLNNETYFINRSGHYNKSGKYLIYKVDFYKIDADGNKINLNGEQRYDTNKNIIDYIGTFEDFILTAFSVQNKNYGFIDKGNSDRKDLIIQFMGLHVFDKLYDYINEIYKNKLAIYKNEKQNYNYVELLDEQKHKLNELKLSYEEIGILYNTSKSDASKLQTEISLLKKDIKQLNNINILSEEEIENKIKLLYNENDNLMVIINKLNLTTLNDLLKESEIIKDELVKYNIDEINKYEIKLTELDDVLKKYNLEIIKLEHELHHINEKSEKLNKLEYDEDCKYCMNNIFVKDAIETKKLINVINDKLTNLHAKMNKLKDEREEINKFVLYKNEYIKIMQNKITCDNNIKNTNEKINSFTSKLNLNKIKIEELKNNLSLLKENIEIINNNNILESIIKDKQLELTKINLQAQQYNTKLIDLYSDIKHFKLRIIDYEAKLKSFNELESLINLYELYLNCIKRDGIPYNLINKAFKLIEVEVNNILSQIVDFSISFELDESKNINLYIIYNNSQSWSIELSSGMEKFISSIAIRVALTSISNLPRTNFLIIDEGWGNLDEENLNWVSVLLTYLKSQFKFILTISHIEHINDVVDTSIDLCKIDGYSKIDMK